MFVERIGHSLETPWLLAFDSDVLIILRRTLVSAFPREGCALLLGDRSDQGWNVRAVWPCCNVWRSGLEGLPELADQWHGAPEDPSTQAAPSLHNRFAIDPREQLLAQRWGRHCGCQVLGSAHSHPGGEAIPSLTDRRWLYEPSLMVIMAKDHSFRAWWLEPEAGAVAHTD